MKKILILFMLVAGLIGTVLFFPVKIDAVYTCPYHRLFEKSSEASQEIQIVDHRTEKRDEASVESPAEGQTSYLVKRYIKDYAVFWWGSLLVILVGIHIIRSGRSGHTTMEI